MTGQPEIYEPNGVEMTPSKFLRQSCFYIVNCGNLPLCMASKLHTACGDTTLKNGAGKETMEFLKDILGEDLYKQVSDTVNAYNGKPENKDKQVKLADLGSGQYVDKGN